MTKMTAEPLTKEEIRWLKKLEKVFWECPSDRIGFYTIGDADLTVIDEKILREYDLEIADGKAHSNGIYLGFISTKIGIQGVSG